MDSYTPNIEELKTLLWEKQGLNSFEILEILIQRGYKYSRYNNDKNVSFDNLISQLPTT